MTMADEIVVMHEGRIEQRGTPQALYERPETAFVANFLGVSNLVDGTVGDRGPDHVEIRTDDGTALRVPADRVGARTGTVQVGVRPEKVSLLGADAHVPDDVNALRGTVVVASYLGVALQYQVRTAAGQELTAIAQNRGAASDGAVSPGQDVVLTWDPGHTFVVGREEERA